MSIFFDKLSEVCHELLLQNNNLIGYLKDKRGLTDRIIRSYKIGAFPKDLRVLFDKIHPEELKSNNIIWSADKSPFQQYPIIIPIRDFLGNTIAIGGRTLISDEARKDSGLPKYRNSNYTKTAHLFGLDKAKDSIRDMNKVYVVEGYFDTITAHQNGLCNVVATCGTLFSLRQLIVLLRYTNNICLLFDNDDAGHTSASRLMQKFSNIENINLEYKFTPDNSKDLDEFLRSGGDFSVIDSKFTNLQDIRISTLW